MLQTIYGTFQDLDDWRDAAAEVIQPSAGSDLAQDDERWPYLRASTLASVGLGSAREHLHAVRTLVKARELFPSATPTLCRSALIGGSQAVWMLEPRERDERLRRSLSLTVEDYERHIQFNRDVVELFPAEQVGPNADEELGRLAQRRDQVMLLLEDVGGKCSINLTTEIIPTALEFTVRDAGQRGQMMPRWRSMSGAAHALPWHFFGNEGTTATDLDDGGVGVGVGVVTVNGDVQRLLMDYMTAYHVAAAGWRLMAARCAP